MRSLMSENNDQRKAAEAQFEALVRTPPQAAPLMCTAMAACGDHTVRSMTTIMFRKRVDAKFFAGLDPATQVGLRGAAVGLHWRQSAACAECRLPPPSSSGLCVRLSLVGVQGEARCIPGARACSVERSGAARRALRLLHSHARGRGAVGCVMRRSAQRSLWPFARLGR